MDQLKIKRDQQLGLMRAMRVSDKDLDANRRGILSDNQRCSLRNQQFMTLLFWGFVALLGVLPLIFPGRWLPATDTNQLQLLGLAAFAIGMAFWGQYNTGQALNKNEAVQITKALKTSRRTENVKTVCRAILGQKKFKIEQNVYDWLQEGTVYTFYYIAQTNALLSIELPLTEEEKRRLCDDSEKEKRLAEPDILMKGITPEEDVTAPEYSSEEN
jgi:hypothetical protein